MLVVCLLQGWRLLKGRGWRSLFSEKEVFEALKGFSGDKVFGPDGFSMAFWQSS